MNGKIALGALGGIGLITTVSVVSFRSGSPETSWEKGIPSCIFLYADPTFMSDQQGNGSSRFGYRYAGLLVSDMELNRDWWKWSYKNLKEDLKEEGDPLKATFKIEDTSTVVPNSADSLKTWCKSVYEVDTGSQEPPLLFNNKSIWKYCSPIQTAPVSLEETYPENTVGKELKLALLDLNKNDRIWHHRNKFFIGIPEDKFEEDSNLSIFKQERRDKRNIKDICSDIYRKPNSEINSIFFTFCSIGQTLVVPVESV